MAGSSSVVAVAVALALVVLAEHNLPGWWEGDREEEGTAGAYSPGTGAEVLAAAPAAPAAPASPASPAAHFHHIYLPSRRSSLDFGGEVVVIRT